MKKKLYLTLDTETATLPFANELATTAKEKQKIAIAKPLVYDIGWVITDRSGNVISQSNFLVQETFFVPNVFNTAYYKDKRPIYISLLEQGKIIARKWNDIIAELIKDLEMCDLVTAYNACFDFKKAIPFTEKYINHLYSANYNGWEAKQYWKCKKLIEGKEDEDNKNPEYLKPYFELRNRKYPILDLWGKTCTTLINNNRYKEYCLKNGLLTASGSFFKSSAETSFQYVMKQHEFEEEHTALSDAQIEAAILTKILKKCGVKPEICPFPFETLGSPIDYALTKPKYLPTVVSALKKYIEDNDGYNKTSNYWNKVIEKYEKLLIFLIDNSNIM